jgi:enterochelin esterase-like enzyme
MKNMILAILILTSGIAHGLPTDDFHSLIVESAEARKVLSQKLRKSVEMVDVATREQNQRQQRIVITESESQIENVAVPSHSLRNSLKNKGKMTASEINKDKMERLSQEVDEAKE